MQDKVKEVDTKDISIDVKDIKVDEEPKPSKIKIASLANITEKPKPRPIAPKVPEECSFALTDTSIKGKISYRLVNKYILMANISGFCMYNNLSH